MTWKHNVWRRDGMVDLRLAKADVPQGPVVFISHRTANKCHARRFASQLDESEVDFYLDENDVNLSTAVALGDADKITSAIEQGIARSTHMAVLGGPDLFSSPWVPFEIGAMRAKLNALYGTVEKSRIVLTPDSAGTLPTPPPYLSSAKVLSDRQAQQLWFSELLGRPLAQSRPRLIVRPAGLTKRDR